MKILSVFPLIILKNKELTMINRFLKEMNLCIEQVESAPTKIHGLCILLNFSSNWLDGGEIKRVMFKISKSSKSKALHNILAQLNKTVERAGERGAFNRAQKGEELTLDKMYLGEVFGIWDKQASFWIDNRERFENQDSGVPPKPESGRKFISVWYCINDHQAGGFIDNHLQNLKKQAPRLQAALRAA